MIVGFTGTRASLAPEQLAALTGLFAQLDGAGVERVTLHHGCCIGGDAEAVRLAIKGGWRIEAHPPENEYLVDPQAMIVFDVKHPPEPYLVRNRAIVAVCDVLVACPKGPEEFRGSGTWATIRDAVRRGKRTLIVWPNGSVTERH